ncbi:MAG: DUF6984 family protein [Pseudanabaena sp.]
MRLLKTEEASLIKALLMTNSKIAEIIVPTLDTTFVENMDDGGMGSLLFISCTDDSNRKLGKTLAEAEFLDEDQVPVCVQLNLDNHNQLFELDIWKVDYSPVSRWPNLEQIVIKAMI